MGTMSKDIRETNKYDVATLLYLNQWRIQDFPEVGAPTPKFVLFCQFFAENYMKMKEFGSEGMRVPGAPLDPPMLTLLINKLADLPPSFHIPARTFSQMIKIFCIPSFNEQADSKQAGNYTMNMELSYPDRYLDILWYWPLESKFSRKTFCYHKTKRKTFLFLTWWTASLGNCVLQSNLQRKKCNTFNATCF